jgi:hypothetical protein
MGPARWSHGARLSNSTTTLSPQSTAIIDAKMRSLRRRNEAQPPNAEASTPVGVGSFMVDPQR